MACHLTLREREFLDRLWEKGLTKTKIAELLGRHHSTISRELRRNSRQGEYRPERAQQLADKRRRKCRRPRKLDDAETHAYVRERLEKRWSPDQIAGRCRRDFPRQRSRWLSHQTIYRWINEKSPRWKAWLRRGGRKPEKRGKLAECVRIDGRPEIINRRRRYGDWEGDTIVGKGRRNALVTLVERKSGYLRMGRVDSMKADATRQVAVQQMKNLPTSLRRSVTFDNGKEFAEHERLGASLRVEVYFALPYCSWQRGTNENTNGLVRQFYPKGTDFSRINHDDVARVETLLNERPRKRLGYLSPSEKLEKRLSCI
jgi:transposase, IS30 family